MVKRDHFFHFCGILVFLFREDFRCNLFNTTVRENSCVFNLVHSSIGKDERFSFSKEQSDSAMDYKKNHYQNDKNKVRTLVRAIRQSQKDWV
jgi:hypothetical protein